MHATARRLAILGVIPLSVAGMMLPAANADSTARTAAGTSAVTSTAAQTDPDSRYVRWNAANTWAKQQTVRTYWNRSRLMGAQPFDIVLTASGVSNSTGRSNSRSNGSSATVGQPSAFAPTLGRQAIGNSNRVTKGALWPGTGAIATTAGRVFFTLNENGRARTASCSGTAVTSANRSVVITAGHCVKSGGRFHTNWVFVPGFNNGNRPFGTWVATNLFTTPQWNANEDLNFDVGAAVVAPLNGRNLVDVVGGQGIAFNQARRQQMYSFGYPAAQPFDGSSLIFCAGRAKDDDISSNDLGLGCIMTGGSSGGPWFLAFNERTGAGVVNSVNSFKYNFDPNTMYGPFFGQEAQAVFAAAQAQGAQ
ncbi:peptidase [Thermopolyspora sp. NPDC052614]|uniref:trypsin-like serine peptidase n=1 Tax=Thermopolyspora sp. NPDC052614 TaxID=3155682 RepID=UPI00343E5C61